MKRCVFLVAVVLCAVSCGKGGENVALEEAVFVPAGNESVLAEGEEREALVRALENIAELERAGAFSGGLGIRESVIRESLGDFSGAVFAAFKELAWAYGGGLIQREELEEGLDRAAALEGISGRTARGVLDFVHGRWAEARVVFDSLDDGVELDSFVRWMILCCALEIDRNDRQAASAYRAIRARYAKFPEYWFRGARFFSGVIAAEYAERCVALAPGGPFAEECRGILAVCVGLDPKDASALRCRSEIESLISDSVNRGEPGLLAPLFPLIALPDNSYTVYAAGAMRALAAVPRFADYFREEAARSSGRLAERLAYICGAAL